MKKRAIIISFIVLCIVVIGVIVFKTVNKGDNAVTETHKSIEDEATIKAQEGSYSLKVVTVYDTIPDTDEKDPPKAEKVAVVVYEYTNDDISHGLSIGSAHFKAYDKKGNMLEQYPQKNLFEASEVGESGTFTASVAFALNNDENYLKIEYYNDVASEKPDATYEHTW
ncbi:MAG: hypothetical protein ACI4IF_07010 [Acutalibacteraceae bacterium]